MRLLDIGTIRDIRLATKALAGLPQHWLQSDVVEGLERVARTAARRGVNLAIHTHVNHVNSLTPLVARATQTALEVGVRDVRNQGVLMRGVNLAIHTHVNHRNSLTPLVAKAAKTALEAGVRDVRNQGVLMRGVNADSPSLLDLCFALQGEASILPYYFYMCDMIPNAEHWRVSVWQAQQLQHDIMGYLPGYATPRIICDVPFVGKRWVHMVSEYDREHGISYWTKNYRTSIEAAASEDVLAQQYPYYDPIDTLPESGQKWWRKEQG
jgi:lysine 2,3-aminomutase